MDINYIFYNAYNERNYFELVKGERPWHVFLLIKKGSFQYQINGSNYVINENEIAYFPANTPFTRQIITPISFHQLAFTIEDDNHFFNSLTAGKLSIPKGHVKCVLETLSTAQKLDDDKSDFYKHVIKSLMVENFVYKKSISSPKNAYPKDISSVIEHMSFNLSNNLNIPDMAKMINLSHVGLIWKFRKFVGSTPSQYLIAMRMREAKNLLIESDLAVKEIAVRCGYDSPYYFSNAFNDFFGQRPTKFRKAFI